MQRLTTFLYYASRTCAIFAIIAAMLLGFIDILVGLAFTCFDNCPTPDRLVPMLSTAAVRFMTPCVALELLALVFFLSSCASSGQMRRAVKPVVSLLLGSIVGVALLSVFLLYLQSHLPVTPDGYLVERSVERWAVSWGLSVMVSAVLWTGVFAYLQGPLLKQPSATE